MKHFLLFLLLLTCGALIAQQPIDVLHYRFDIALSDRNDSIHCKATIKFLITKPSMLIDFDLADAMRVDYVRNCTTDQSIDFLQSNNKIAISSPKELKAGDSMSLMIAYKGIPKDGLIISRNKYGNRTFFADNWPNRGHNWLACIDDPIDKAPVDYYVTAPSQYKVIANGVRDTILATGNNNLTHWKETVPIPVKVMVIGVARFAIDNAGIIEGIPISSWVYPEEQVKGFYDYALAKTILPFYIHYIGPYPYKKLANVQSKTTFGGLENANAIFYSENSITGTRSIEDLMAHEIAHQWFGDMATEKKFAHLWLSEGFATYMSILYMQSRYGRDTAVAMLQQNRNDVINFRTNRPVVDTVSSYMDLLNANSYQKGGWVLHMLHHQLGDSIFRQCIRNYFSSYGGRNADTRDLQAVMEKTSNKNLGTFFNQWLYQPGIPQLKVEWSYNSKMQQVDIDVTQIQKQSFTFPLELAIIGSDGKFVKETAMVTGFRQRYSYKCPAKPDQLILDPGTNLLFSASIRELPQTK